MTAVDDGAVAIVGMRSRVPGAEDVDQLWRNIAGGVESITTLSAEDMQASGVPESVTALPGYVNAAPLLGDVDMFDAAFFGFSARDAALTDPQHRLFLETAWEALEDAGYEPGTFPGAIGVFGGCEMSTYLYQLSRHPDALGYVDGMQLMVTNDKDHLCTQVSYRLNLRGPSVVVQTTCSTSLVAVAMACESLRSGRSDMALAGGVTVRVPQRGGYLYVAGSILSPDGHCRPFDANAQGTIVGSGVGLVVLKRLADAVADGDTIHAVIRGMGINNDGSDKVGYTAPAFRGQVAAIAAAYEAAGVSPESVGYVEAHGTGTILGDPIEVSALTEVFRRHTARRGFCGIGSAKSNFGHLSCAAGVTGLIRAVLALEHGAIPPTVHYRSPNPALDLAASPFYVTTSPHPWERNGTPRRAAVSSFGVGGTNAHAVLEEAPAPPEPAGSRPHQLLTLSARSVGALDEMTRRLGTHLTAHPERDLADAAFTLHVGRRDFTRRRSVVVDAGDRARAVSALLDTDRLAAVEAASTPPPVVFMFPGQGAQYPGMAAGLYRHEPLVKQVVDRCCRVLKPELGLDLRRVLFPGARRRATAAAELRDTALAQPALFVVGYALARLWRSWGIEPAAMIGHSIGEYVAATLAGVLELDDALRLLAQRGRLISALPPGSMLAVMAPARDVEEFVDGEVCLAAVNAPGLCVLSGPADAIDRVARGLEDRSVVARRLHTSHAFHSSMMEPMLDEFEALVADIPLSPPTRPYIATLQGDWASDAPLKPSYWSAQIRSAVQFADGMQTLRAPGSPAAGDAMFLEVGPGRTLTTFAAHGADPSASSRMLVTLPAPEEDRADTAVITAGLGELWARGVAVDWDGYHATGRRRRVSLPTYPFERQSYWIGQPNNPNGAADAEVRDPADWFATPVWSETPLDAEARDLTDTHVLIVDDETGVGAACATAVRDAGATPVLIRRGPGFSRTGPDEYTADPDGLDELAGAVCAAGQVSGLIHCLAAGPIGDGAEADLAGTAGDVFLHPLRLAVALAAQPTALPLPIVLAARGTARAEDADHLDPLRCFGIGAAKVLPQEHAGLRVTHVDIDLSTVDTGPRLLAELATGAPESEVALRGPRRLVRGYEPAPIAETLPPPGLPSDPVILVTGGLGHMGLALAEAAFGGLNAKLVLVGRSPLPPPPQWAEASTDPSLDPTRRAMLRRVALMRAERDDVLVVGADLNDPVQVSAAVDAAIERFGRVDLVVHGAANVGPDAFGLCAETDASVVGRQLSPKIAGLLHLIEAMRGREPERWVIHGSISAVLGGLGLAAYAGANAVLDAIAERESAGGTDVVSIVWDAWDNAGEAQSVAIQAITSDEGRAAFLRVLGATTGPLVVVAVNDLESRLESWIRLATVPKPAGVGHPRPDLSTAFVQPRTDTEATLARIWASQLGLDEVGVHDRFFDLGGHSLLAVQVAAEIRDEFGVDLPVLQLFKAPTVAEVAGLIDNGGTAAPSAADSEPDIAVPDIVGEGPGAVTKASYREFYDDMTRRLEATGMSEASFFLNYGYLGLGAGDERTFEPPDDAFNRNSIRLAAELIGGTELDDRAVLDVGSGRGGTAALIADRFRADVVGVDLSPEAVAFCSRTHRSPRLRFEVGDAEHLPLPDASVDVVTNLESSHTYPDMRAFLAEVRRVLRPGGWFLHTDLLAESRWLEVRAILQILGLTTENDRDITANVLASCDEIASGRVQAFGDQSAMIDNFLAVPGSPVYEQMNTGIWQYRVMRSRRT